MKQTTNKLMKKAMGLKGFLSSMSKPKMKKGGFPDLNKDGEITKADILMGRGVIDKPKMKKGGMGFKSPMAKEAAKNTKPTIPHSYYQMGGMDNMNPLSSMLPKKPKMGMKPKMAMGGDFFPQNPLTASKYKGDTLMGQSFKKGGMTKKKKK